MAPARERPATKTIATNREARHEYFVLEALETGVELKGTEVKSLRAGGVNLKDSWVDIEDGELLVKGMHITPTTTATSSIRTLCGCGVCWPTRPRSGVCTSSASCRAILSFPFLSTSSMAASRWKSACARAKALRQACRRRQARCQALHRPGREVQRQILLNLFQVAFLP